VSSLRLLDGAYSRAVYYRGSQLTAGGSQAKHGKTDSNTPKKNKRTFDEFANDKTLTALTSASSDTRTEIQKTQMSIGTMNASVARLSKEVSNLKRYVSPISAY
jgi:hypothetical protein